MASAGPHVLIVDDEKDFREDVAALLRRRGMECRTVGDAAVAIEQAHKHRTDAILCDVVMPGGGAIALLRELGDQSETGVFVMTAFGSLENAMEAFRAGAVDYLIKPLNLEEVELKIRRFLSHRETVNKLRSLRCELSCAGRTAKLVGNSRPINAVRELIERVAPTRTTVLITGETGTGKEITARLIHQTSPYREEPFVAVNCAALHENLLEAELFGHEMGAFTGAIRAKAGLFEAAEGGTLFLDEIGDMALGTQAKLLRAVEQKEITRLGSTEPRPVNVRVIASTHRNLAERVKSGLFREDLFYRLSVVEIHVPALRDRKEDLPALVDRFLQEFNAELKRSLRGVDQAALQLLMAYSYPGNVRELRNVLERAVILTQGETIGAPDLPDRISGDVHVPPPTADLRAALRVYEREHVRQVLAAANGNKEEAARRLGIDPATLYRKLAGSDHKTR